MVGLPTTQVLLDDGTGTFPYDITAKAMLLDGYGFSRGREDEQAAVTAGQLSLTLNNDDGRFTPGSTIIASPSPIKVDQRIRVKETVNGTTYTRFTGYVKSWPVSWPFTVGTVSRVQVTATDAQARAERRVLRSVVEEEIMADSPPAYYTLGEPEGAVAAGDTSGNQAAVLVMAGTGTDVTFGTDTGPGTDGLTAAHFAGGKYLISSSSLTLTGTDRTLIVAVNVSAAPGVMVTIAGSGDLVGCYIGMDSTGHIVVIGPSGTAVVTSAAIYSDSVGHVAEATVSGGTATLYVDGASQGSGAVSTPGLVGYLYVGGAAAMTGTVAHVAIFATALSGARITAHATAMLTGFSGESDTARMTRLAGYANLPLGTLDASLTNVAFKPFDGSTAWAAIQDVADAAVGVTYVDGSGNLTFHNRNKVVAKTTPDLTVDITYLTGDFSPIQDDQRIVNYLETTADATSIPQLVRNATSETSHGRYDPGGKSYLVLTDPEALDRANWIVANLAEPITRYPAVTFNLMKLTTAQATALLTAVELDAWIRVTTLPTQNTDGTIADLIVEGYSERVSGTEWTLTCQVVTRSLFSPVWILDSTTFSVLGSTTRLYI
jgi:hypothetical protein